MIVLIAGLAAFMTWMTLSLSDVSLVHRAVACALVFLAVGGTLLHYVVTCMRRHCRHAGHRAPHA
jgi:hypothetical protein